MPPRLSLRAITKRYPAVVANDGVSLDVQPGEIHAVLGENGAGKSTLMKVIAGAVQPDAGRIEFDGRAVTVPSPAAALALGIAMVHQHFALFETLTVAENVRLGLGRDWTLARVRAQLAEVGARYGLTIAADAHVQELSMGERQRVEILRALLSQPRLLILDEPTSVLTPQAVERLFDTLRRLAADGVSVLFISHKLDEIRALAGLCTVMRGGRVVAQVDPRERSEAELARLMIGGDPPQIAAHVSPPGAPRLVLRGLPWGGSVLRSALPAADAARTDAAGTAAAPAESRTEVPLNLTVRSGEIVGVAGISGNGQRELMALLSGEVRSAAAAITLDGAPIGALGPRERRALGLRYVPEERLRHGAVPELSLAENTLLTGDRLQQRGFIDRAGMRELARSVIARYAVKAPGPEARAASLSGGNLQKFIVGREIDAAPRALVVNQPTWGVDVGAAAAIRNALIALRAQGCALLVVSEEIDELFELADTLVVIAGRRLSPPVRAHDIGVDELGRWMAGLWPGQGPAGAAAFEAGAAGAVVGTRAAAGDGGGSAASAPR
jgi:simple sugar transport system ATP-binding protein